MGCESSSPKGVISQTSSKKSPSNPTVKKPSTDDHAEQEFDLSTKYMTSGKGISSQKTVSQKNSSEDMTQHTSSASSTPLTSGDAHDHYYNGGVDHLVSNISVSPSINLSVLPEGQPAGTAAISKSTSSAFTVPPPHYIPSSSDENATPKLNATPEVNIPANSSGIAPVAISNAQLPPAVARDSISNNSNELSTPNTQASPSYSQIPVSSAPITSAPVPTPRTSLSPAASSPPSRVGSVNSLVDSESDALSAAASRPKSQARRKSNFYDVVSKPTQSTKTVEVRQSDVSGSPSQADASTKPTQLTKTEEVRQPDFSGSPSQADASTSAGVSNLPPTPLSDMWMSKDSIDSPSPDRYAPSSHVASTSPGAALPPAASTDSIDTVEDSSKRRESISSRPKTQRRKSNFYDVVGK